MEPNNYRGISVCSCLGKLFTRLLGNGDGSFSQMSRGSLFFVRTVDVVYTDVVGNASPTLAFLRGIGLGVACLWSGEGYLTG